MSKTYEIRPSGVDWYAVYKVGGGRVSIVSKDFNWLDRKMRTLENNEKQVAPSSDEYD